MSRVLVVNPGSSSLKCALVVAGEALSSEDVALVVGANDVVNPLARVAGSAIAGMPILDADKAAAVIVMKRSMGHGYAGVDNPLFVDPRTGMLFADAKVGLEGLQSAIVRLGLPAVVPA